MLNNKIKKYQLKKNKKIQADLLRPTKISTHKPLNPRPQLKQQK